MKRSWIKRRLRGQRLRHLGRKGKEWANARNKLKVIFKGWGITTCEECFTTDGLGFAHLNKRRNLAPEDLGNPHKTVLLCNQCHWQHEQKGERQMAIELQRIIDNRVNLERAA